MRDYSFKSYIDIDGEERTWLENDICPWDDDSLRYLHRAREFHSLYDDTDED